MMSRLLFITFFLGLRFFVFAQSEAIDTFKRRLNAAKSDTVKVDMLVELSIEYYYLSDLKTAMRYIDSSAKLSKHLNYLKGLAASYEMAGTINVGFGNYPLALEKYLNGLNLYEKINYKKGISDCMAGIGSIYLHQEDLSEATEYYTNSLNIKEKINDKYGIGICLNSMALIYEKRHNFPKALQYHFRTMKIYREVQHQIGVSASLSNIGAFYDNNLNNPDTALSYHRQSLSLSEQIGDKYGIALGLISIGKLSLKKKKYSDALTYFKRASIITEQIKAMDLMRDVHLQLSQTYKSLKQHDKALDHFQKHITARDSMFNEENTRKLVQTQMTYEFDKQSAFIKSGQEKKELLHNAELEKEQIQRYWLYGGLGIVLLFTGLLFNRFRLIRKQNKIIATQKNLVDEKNKHIEEKNKDIVDSINYAKRIQESILPSENDIKKVLPDCFVLYKPKDIVSGDFYFIEFVNTNDGKKLVAFAAADCTGHGVPGAFMSILGVNILRQSLSQREVNSPAEALDYLNRNLNLALRQKSREQQIQDGMDIAFCVLNPVSNELYFAGANNPLWIVRKDKSFIEIPADKQPIGYFQNQQPFKNQKMKLNKEDMVYVFTDGYADQFGGERGKKFKYKQLMQKLIEIRDQPTENQKTILEQLFNDWKSDLEQVDDILIIGARV